MDKGEGVRVNTPTREEQLYSKLNFERERSLKLNQYAIDLQNELKAEQQAHNALKTQIDNGILEYIKNANFNIYARHEHDEENAEVMEQLVKFKLKQMFTATESLQAEQTAHQCTLNVLHDTMKRLKEGDNTNTLVADIEQYIDDIKGVE